MKVLELFAGTRSIGKAFEKRGHEVFSVEWNKDFENIDLYEDISKLAAETILEKFGRPDVIWASPDCTSFSVAAIGYHRRKDPLTGSLIPKTEYANFCDETDQHVLDLIEKLNPKYFFIENPRGGMRSMLWMKNIPRYTVTYCHYGDTRMKPTDIWTNHPEPKFLPPCKNGDPCHVSAPRGTRTGTQGLKGAKERSLIPDLLCQHIAEISEEEHETKNISFWRNYKKGEENKMEERFFKQAEETFLENDCKPGDTINAFNKSVDKSGTSPTVTTRPEGFKTAILPVVETPDQKQTVYKIRKLTPKECYRLMDVTDEDADKMLSVNSNSQCYKQAGNSIVVACLIGLFSQLNIKGVKTWNEGLYKELGYGD